MEDILKKLLSRKFILAMVGVVSGLAMACGIDGNEINEVVTSVGGILTALGSIVSYNAAEAKIDAAKKRDAS